MAVSAASALNVTGTDTDARDYSTASWTPTTGKVYLAAISQLDLGSARTAPTCSGNSLTWTLVDGTAGTATQPGLYVFRAYANGSQTTGALTFSGCVSSGQTADGAVWGIAELTDANPASPIVQTAVASVTADTITANLAAFGSAGNATGAWVVAYDNASTTGPAITAGTGFAITTGLDAGQAMGGDGTRLAFEFKNSNDTGVDATAAAANDRMLIVAFEIKAVVVTTGTAAGSATGSGSAVGTRTVLGSGAGASTASGSAVGAPVRSGTAAGAGTSSGSAVGVRTVLGVAGGAGTASGSATGLRTVVATAAGSAAAVGSAVGVRTAYGTANGGSTSSGSATGSTGSSAPEAERFAGGPISIRDLDRMKWEEQLERLLREDEELLCLI